MGGYGSGRKRGPDKPVPRGARWRETRQRVLVRDQGVCGICHHPGASEVDHITPTSDLGLYFSPGNLQASHGSRIPCPVCGKACNQVKGSKAPRQRAGERHNHPGDARKTGELRRQPREIVVGYRRSVVLADYDRCAECVSHYRESGAEFMSVCCWSGRCADHATSRPGA